MKKIFTSYLIALTTLGVAQTWTKVSGILDSSQVKGIGVINNQILVAGQNWLNNAATDYALSNDGGATWSKLPTYQFAGFLPNTLPQNNLQICSNGFTFSKKLVGNTWQSFAGANNFAEFTNGSIIGSAGSSPDTIYNFSSTGVKGTKLGNYTFKLSSKYCKGSNNRVFVFAYGVGLGYIDYTNLGVVNIPATLNGNAMTQTLWDMKLITDMIRTSNGNLFAIGDGVFKSTDNGVNWTTILSLSGTAVTSIAKNASDELFILAGSAQVRKSTDLGTTFTNISGNLPSVGAFKKELFVNISNEVFVILNNNGGINAANSGIYKLSSGIGLNELEKNKIAFNLFPNPTNGFLTIEAKELTEPTFVSITNILGEIILNERLTSYQQTINLSGVKSGVYGVTLKSTNKISTQKLIIQ